jgi:putative glutamine amidotransferase
MLLRLARVFLLLLAGVFLFVPCTFGQEKPKVGLVYNADQYQALIRGKDRQFRYRRGLERAGASVVILSHLEDPAMTAMKLKFLDGLLLPGGDDIDPAYYGETPHPKLEIVDRPLDEFEFMLMKRAHQGNLPVFGICRGAQLLNVFFGGTLFQDIPTQVAAPTPVAHRLKVNGESRHCAHEMMISPDSLLFPAFGPAATINSYHHQAAKRLGNTLQITGVAPDGVVEMFENTQPPFILGVQFHPERMLEEDPRWMAPFHLFLKAVRRNQPVPAAVEKGH